MEIPAGTEYVVTVTGEVPADRLGMVSAHEHLYCDISSHSGNKDNIIQNVDLIVEELDAFLQVGGRTIVEVTPADIGRNPAALKLISERSGVQIVSGIAFYDHRTLPGWLHDATVEQIARFFISELEKGSDGVRAGLIGELATANQPGADAATYVMSPVETRIFQAAARAQQETGAAISTHASIGRAGHAQLRVLEEAGADLEKVVIGHCDAQWHEDIERDLAYYLPIVEKGACCEFDLLGWEELMPDSARAERMVALLRRGFSGQLLLGTDTCRLSQLHAFNGRGYDYIFTAFLPMLIEQGGSTLHVARMMIGNPKRILARRR